MDQQRSSFDWSKSAVDAAELLADGRHSQEEVAERVGVSRSTVRRWLKDPDFAAKVDEHVEEYAKEVRRKWIASQMRRVAAQHDRWMRMQRVIEARADDPDMEKVPGGTTGLITRDWKTVGSGESAQIMPVYSVDTGLLRELREHEKLAAQELGQWEERQATKEPTTIVVKMADAEPVPDADSDD